MPTVIHCWLRWRRNYHTEMKSRYILNQSWTNNRYRCPQNFTNTRTIILHYFYGINDLLVYRKQFIHKMKYSIVHLYAVTHLINSLSVSCCSDSVIEQGNTTVRICCIKNYSIALSERGVYSGGQSRAFSTSHCTLLYWPKKHQHNMRWPQL